MSNTNLDCEVLVVGAGPTGLIAANLDRIGHIQIASVPDRSEPDHGAVDYPDLLRRIDELGYEGHIGAEYRPRGTTDEGLGWMAAIATG